MYAHKRSALSVTPRYPLLLRYIFTSLADKCSDVITFVFSEVIWRTSCIRAIVTFSESLSAGALHVVTISGATLGRALTCTIPMPEDDIEEVCCLGGYQCSQTPIPADRHPQQTFHLYLSCQQVHCEIEYIDSDRSYYLTDRGTGSGTFINSHRLSEVRLQQDGSQRSTNLRV